MKLEPTRFKNGGAGEIQPCVVKCKADVFENAIREIGVGFACEWFGYDSGSDFERETINILRERSAEIKRED